MASPFSLVTTFKNQTCTFCICAEVLKIYVHLLMNKLTSKLFTFFREIIVLTNSENHLNNLLQRPYIGNILTLRMHTGSHL